MDKICIKVFPSLPTQINKKMGTTVKNNLNGVYKLNCEE